MFAPVDKGTKCGQRDGGGVSHNQCSMRNQIPAYQHSLHSFIRDQLTRSRTQAKKSGDNMTTTMSEMDDGFWKTDSKRGYHSNGTLNWLITNLASVFFSLIASFLDI